MAGDLVTRWKLVDQASASIKQAGKNFKKSFTGIRADSKKASKGLQEDRVKETRATQEASTTVTKYGAAFASLATAGTVIAAGRTVLDFATASDQARISMLGLMQIAKTRGQDLATVEEAAKSLVGEGIAPLTDITTGLKNLMVAGLGIDQAKTAMRSFMDIAALGKSPTIDMATAVVNLSQAFKTGSAELGDMSGLTKNWVPIAAQGAKEMRRLGISTEGMSEEMLLAQERYHGLMVEAKLSAGGLEIMQQGVIGATNEMKAAWQEFKEVTGELFAPETEKTIRGWSSFLSGWRKVTQKEIAAAFTWRGINVTAFGLQMQQRFAASKAGDRMAETNAEIEKVTQKLFRTTNAYVRYGLRDEIEALREQEDVWAQVKTGALSYAEAEERVAAMAERLAEERLPFQERKAKEEAEARTEQFRVEAGERETLVARIATHEEQVVAAVDKLRKKKHKEEIDRLAERQFALEQYGALAETMAGLDAEIARDLGAAQSRASREFEKTVDNLKPPALDDFEHTVSLSDRMFFNMVKTAEAAKEVAQAGIASGIDASSQAIAQFALGMREGEKIGTVLIGVWKDVTAQIAAAIIKQQILNLLSAMTGGATGPLGFLFSKGGMVPGYADGGVVYAANGFAPRGTDTVPAMLTPGEGVLTRSAVAGIGGPRAIDALNATNGRAGLGSVNINIGGGTFVGPGGAREFAANLHAELLDLIRTNDYEGLAV